MSRRRWASLLACLLAMLPWAGPLAGCQHRCCHAPIGCGGHGGPAAGACASGGPLDPTSPVAPAPPLAAPQARLLPVPTRPVFLPGSFLEPRPVEVRPSPPPFEPPGGQAPAPLERPSVDQPPSGDAVPDVPRRDRLTSDKPLAQAAEPTRVRPAAWVFAP